MNVEMQDASVEVKRDTLGMQGPCGARGQASRAVEGCLD